MPWWVYIYYVGQIYACLFLWHQGKGWQRPLGLLLAVVSAFVMYVFMIFEGVRGMSS